MTTGEIFELPELILENTVSALVGLVVFSVSIGMVREAGLGGPFTPIIDILAVIIGLVFDPSTYILLAVAGAIITYWNQGF